MTILPPKGSRAIPVAASAVLAGVIIGLLSPVLPVGGPFGYFDARRDIANARLKIFAGMVDHGWHKQWQESVRKKYGIEVGGRPRTCIAGGFQQSYDHAYNTEQRAEIVKRFGKDIVREEMLLAIQAAKSSVAGRELK